LWLVGVATDERFVGLLSLADKAVAIEQACHHANLVGNLSSPLLEHGDQLLVAFPGLEQPGLQLEGPQTPGLDPLELDEPAVDLGELTTVDQEADKMTQVLRVLGLSIQDLEHLAPIPVFQPF